MTDSPHAVGGVPQPDQTDTNVRRVVKMLLAGHEMEPRDLAEHLGVSKSAIYARLSGQKPFTVREVSRMSQLFGLSPDGFFGGPGSLLLGGDAMAPQASGQLAPAAPPGSNRTRATPLRNKKGETTHGSYWSVDTYRRAA